MACCSAQIHHVFTCYSSKLSMNNTYPLKQSHLFFKNADFSGLSSFLKVKREKVMLVPIQYKSKFATSAATTMADQQHGVVIDSEYCTQSYPEELTIAKNADDNYVVSNHIDKSINFYIKTRGLIHAEIVIYDSATNEPLITIRKKILTTDERCQVYRGDSTDDKDLLFSVKTSIIEHFSTVELDVFLPYNNTEEVSDFKITRSLLDEKPWDVYMGNKTIAQIKKDTIFGKDKLVLYVHPYIDRAFIVALSMIANEMDCLQDHKALQSIPTIDVYKRPYECVGFIIREENFSLLTFNVIEEKIMESCLGYSCIIGDPSKVSVSRSPSNTSYGKQSHVFFKNRVSFGLPLKVKKLEKSVFCSCKSTYTGTDMAQQQICPLSSSNSIQVIGSKYCMQYPVDLAMLKKITNLIFSDYVVSHQVDKTTNFYVTRDSNSFHQDFVLRDYADDQPLVTIRKKEKWQVYRGHNTDDKNLLFSVKKSSMKHSNKVTLNIYLSYNILEDVCDFKIAENWLSKNTCDVYMGDNIIAQIQKKDILENRLFDENDKLMLNVYPYVDYAFIVALSLIANEMDCLEDRKTLPRILAYQILHHRIKFMVLLLGGVCIISTKFLAGLICMVMPIISDTKFLAGLKCMVMPIIRGIGIFLVILFEAGFILVLWVLWVLMMRDTFKIIAEFFR